MIPRLSGTFIALTCHSEWSGVEESRDETLGVAPRDSSTSLGLTGFTLATFEARYP